MVVVVLVVVVVVYGRRRARCRRRRPCAIDSCRLLADLGGDVMLIDTRFIDRF